jgi:hypothetical protein
MRGKGRRKNDREDEAVKREGERKWEVRAGRGVERVEGQ